MKGKAFDIAYALVGVLAFALAIFALVVGQR